MLAIAFQNLISGMLSMIHGFFPVVYGQYKRNMNYGRVDIKLIALNVYILGPISENYFLEDLCLIN